MLFFYQKYLLFETIEIMACFIADKGKHGCYWETPQGYIATNGTQIFWRKGTGIISCSWTLTVFVTCNVLVNNNGLFLTSCDLQCLCALS